MKSLFRRSRPAFAAIVASHILAAFGFAQPGAPTDQATPAPQSVRTIAPVYPFDLLIQKKTGSAEAHFTVETSGRAIFVSAAGTESSFAKALLADIESNEFMPPRVNGKPQMTTARYRYPFNGEAGLDPTARAILAELRKPDPAIFKVDQLDKRPAAIRQDPPAYPFSLQSDGVSGRAEIEVIVDRTGRVLFPRIVSATPDDCGWAAASAIARWKFQPPMKDGKPVDARITIPMNFDHTKLVATW